MNRRPARLLLALAGALLLFALLGLTGCKQDNRQLSLYDNETRAYTHPCIGAAMTVPAAWKTLFETEDSVVFCTPETDLTLTLTWELGGYTYYSDADLLEMAAAVAGQVLVEPELLRQLARSLPGNNQLVTAAGPLLGDENGANAICEVMLFSPLPAVRYYLITVAEVDAYETNAKLLNEIYASFYLSEDEDTIYAGLSQDASDEEPADEAETDTEVDNSAESDQDSETKQEPNPEV